MARRWSRIEYGWLLGDESLLNSRDSILRGVPLCRSVTSVVQGWSSSPQGHGGSQGEAPAYFGESLRRDESAGGTRVRLNGTIAPFDGSAAAEARASTSCWMYCTNSWIWRCISSMRSRI